MAQFHSVWCMIDMRWLYASNFNGMAEKSTRNRQKDWLIKTTNTVLTSMYKMSAVTVFVIRLQCSNGLGDTHIYNAIWWFQCGVPRTSTYEMNALKLDFDVVVVVVVIYSCVYNQAQSYNTSALTAIHPYPVIGFSVIRFGINIRFSFRFSFRFNIRSRHGCTFRLM